MSEFVKLPVHMALDELEKARAAAVLALRDAEAEAKGVIEGGVKLGDEAASDVIDFIDEQSAGLEARAREVADAIVNIVPGTPKAPEEPPAAPPTA